MASAEAVRTACYGLRGRSYGDSGEDRYRDKYYNVCVSYRWDNSPVSEDAVILFFAVK